MVRLGGGQKKSFVLLKNFVAKALLIVALGIAFPTVGISQSPGYGQEPDKWAPYESGKYFERLREIMKIYRLEGSKVDYLHYEENDAGIGYVELFRLSRTPTCGEDNCIFVIFSSDIESVPLITTCQFEQAGLAHFFNPDGSKFWGFEFSCRSDGVLQVKVTHTHFMTRPIAKRS